MTKQRTLLTRVVSLSSPVRCSSSNRLLVLLTITAVLLASCSAPGSIPLGNQAQPVNTVGAEASSGCPTPTPANDLGLEPNEGVAGSSVQDAATLEDTMPTDEQNVPSLAEREAMLDRVNQGPARPDARPEGDGVPPDPALELHAGSAEIDAAVPLSGTPDLDPSAATATPCP